MTQKRKSWRFWKRERGAAEAAPEAERASASAKAGAQDKAKTAGSTAPVAHNAVRTRQALYTIGQVVRHRHYPFRGVIFDVDATFQNTDEWYEAIPEEVRPAKDQPYYHLFAENETSHYIAYVSQQNLELDPTDAPVAHPDIGDVFEQVDGTGYVLRQGMAN